MSGKSRHISRTGVVIRVDCREVKQIMDWKESSGFIKCKNLSVEESVSVKGWWVKARMKDESMEVTTEFYSF